MVLRILELFSGYGGASYALKRARIQFRCIGYSDIDKAANYIFPLNHGNDIKQLGDVRNINPDNLEDFDLLSAGFPCVLAGTLITTERGQIPIEDVKIGDVVLTHKNRWRRVVDTMSHMRNHHYIVKFSGCPELKITDNHKIYARKSIRMWNDRTNTRTFSNIEWIPVKDMRKDDFVAIGTWSDKYSKNEKKLTEEECWLLGRYVADGYLYNKGKHKNRITWCIGKHKKEKMEKILKKAGYKFYSYEEQSTQRLSVFDKRMYELCVDCGMGAANKKIPHWIMNLPKNKLKWFLSGYMDGDGCYTNGHYQLTTISRILVHQLGQIVNRLYKTPYSITHNKNDDKGYIEGREVNQRDTYVMRYDIKSHNQDKSVWIANNLWGRFVSKKKIDGRVRTYNITVEEDHSYVANNIVIANCQSFAIQGKREGFKAKDKGNLFFEIIRIAKAKRPKMMLLENVEGILSHDDGRTMRRVLEELGKIDYFVHWKKLYSKDYGTPQNRPRIWFACFRDEEDYLKFSFPEPEPLNLEVKDLLEKEVDVKYYLTEKYLQTFYSNIDKRVDIKDLDEALMAIYRDDTGALPSNPIYSRTMLSSHNSDKTMLSRMPMPFVNQKKIMPTLTSELSHQCGFNFNAELYRNLTGKWRRLTPRECFRFMGFFDDNEIKFGELIDTKLYFLAGNGWEINVASKILRQMLVGNQNKQKGVFDW